MAMLEVNRKQLHDLINGIPDEKLPKAFEIFSK